MAIDTPARIAILGGGPIGIETALYARFLGYDVDVFERGEVGANIRDWGHVKLFTPFSMNHSPLGASALRAQGSVEALPDDDALLTGNEWLDQYLQPLSRVDLLKGCIHSETTVESVGREGYLKSQITDTEERFDEMFLVLTTNGEGEERIDVVDIVIDTTGTYGVPNWMGPGGMPAMGEIATRRQNPTASDGWHSGLPDILGDERTAFQNRSTLVIGSGYSAATNIDSLLTLRADFPDTSISWLVRETPRDNETPGAFPIQRHEADPLPGRDQVAERVNIATQGESVQCLSGLQIHQLSRTDEGRWIVRVGSESTTESQRDLEFDHVIINTGFRGDWSITEELQIHRCYASGGPMKMAASLLQQQGKDCLATQQDSVECLVTTEPNFYVLGSKSYGRWSHFLFERGLDQIRQLFALIADRENLDLYATPLSSADTTD